MKIRNLNTLLSHGDLASRECLLSIVEDSLQSLDSFQILKKVFKWDGKVLRIGDFRRNISTNKRIFVVGAGKACNAMAKAIDEILGERITEGLVIVKQVDPEDDLKRIELIAGGHPLPNEAGLSASNRMLKMVERATPEDLFIGLISGGSSALMSCPLPGITLEDEIKVTELLLKSSARILEINAVRRHISATNGGRLAQRIEEKGAEMINFVLSDVVGERPTTNAADRVRFFGTPVAPDRTTLQDALYVLKKYDLFCRAPHSIVEFLKFGNSTRETPKSFGERIHHFVFQRPADSCEAAMRAAQGRGLRSLVLTTLLEGESQEAGKFLATVAKEIVLNRRPIASPCVLIAGGETTTRVGAEAGEGGPSQELALGFALEISGCLGMSIAAIDTDGTDGPTEIAGGVADASTVERAGLEGLDVYDFLKAHDSSTLLRTLGDEIVTGNTGTNICDLNVIFIA
jgi:glycerate 2-kinase